MQRLINTFLMIDATQFRSWTVWIAVLAAGALAFVLSGLTFIDVQRRLTSNPIQLNGLGSSAVGTQSQITANTARSDYVGSLPVDLKTHVITRRLQQSADLHHVQIMSLSTDATAPSPTRLARRTWVVGVHGTYPDLKQWLQSVMAPHITVQELQLRRGATASDTEATVTLILWGAPLPSAVETR